MNEHVTAGPIPAHPAMDGAASHDCILTPLEMAAFNARLAVLTDRRLVVGPAPITRNQARALWTATRAFSVHPAASAPARTRRQHLSDRRRPSAVAAISVLALSGCATFGGHVKSDFACRAPDGVCAPTSKIDDQALAMISGGDGDPMPAGMVDPAAGDDPRFTPVSATTRLTRTSEKVLRIVFPAHVDRQGRYREASAIHAVVERAAWTQAALSNVGPVIGRRHLGEPQLAAADQGPSLAELASASPEVAFPPSAPDVAAATAVTPTAAPTDPNAPSAASVQAARRKVIATRATTTAQPASPLPARGAPVPALRSATSSTASASANPVSSFDLRKVGGASPLQAIREKVGSIFAAHAVSGRAGRTAAAPVNAEHPVNGPAVLAVSGVEQ